MGTRGPIGQSAQEAWLKGSRRRAPPRTMKRARVDRLPVPRDLDGEAREYWRAVVPKLCKAGQLTALDVPALKDMCVCWQRLCAAEAEIARDGVTIEGYRGSRVKHPAVTIAKSYRESLQKYQQKFGLQPMDRQRLQAPEEDPGPTMEELLLGKVWAVAGEDPRTVLEREADPLAELRGEVGE